MTSENTTRREFTRQALQSITALALIEGLAARNLFGRDVSPIIDAWFTELHGISKDLKDHKTKDVEFQKSLEGLYKRADLPTLLKTLDFEKLAAGVDYPEHGAKSLPNKSRITVITESLLNANVFIEQTKSKGISKKNLICFIVLIILINPVVYSVNFLYPMFDIALAMSKQKGSLLTSIFISLCQPKVGF